MDAMRALYVTTLVSLAVMVACVIALAALIAEAQ